jgi:SAM-dependent methyltransferase
MASAEGATGTIGSRGDSSDRSRHWDAVYGRRGTTGVSWYQPVPSVSLELVAELGIPPATAVVDVGGGASGLARSLVERGFSDVSVLDVSSAALDAAREGIGQQRGVHWLQHDLLTWEPQGRYGLWHDRAVFHFLVDQQERDRYLDVLSGAVAPGGHVIIATFAPDGPQQCSGLPVARYGPDDLSRVLGDRVDVLATRREEHVTPGGTIQPFTWIAGRVRPA